VRALLIVNPHATSTTRLRRDVIVHALASAVNLEVVETRYRGDATAHAAAARQAGFGLVLTLGGDGTVNEALNGLLGGPAGIPAPAPGNAPATGSAPAAGNIGAGSGPAAAPLLSPGAGPGAASLLSPGAGPAPASALAGEDCGRGDGWERPGPDQLPMLAPLPGGSANVFTRALGLPADPIDAAGRILQALADSQHRDIGVGLAGRRYFAFNAGLGLDAEVVRAVEGQRAQARPVTPALYARMAIRQFYRLTDRSRAALTLERDGHPADGPFFLGIVSNTAPWTYLGRRPVNANPQADFDCALDVLALRNLHTAATLRVVRQILFAAGPPQQSRSLVRLHDEPALDFTATRPVAFQVDGEYMGEYEHVRFVAVPKALRVIAGSGGRIE
jgi:diacylglycerol kinase family enzyme